MAATAEPRRLAAAFGLLLAALWLGQAAEARTPPVVNCHDEARRIVTPTLRHQCDGRIVDDEEAAAIRAERAERIRARLDADREELFPGRRRHKMGTGFFVVEDGTMLTNTHVVDGCAALSVEAADGTAAVGRVVARHDGLDLALVAADAAPAAVARFAPAARPAPGLRADLVGYPTQGIPPERPLLTAGTVAVPPARLRAPAHFLVEASVRSGNSGGPVLDQHGRVIGIVFAQLDIPGILERTGEVLPDTAVAIDSPAVQAFLRQHRVAYLTADGGRTLDREQAHAQARDFVARVQCWR